MRLVSLDVRGFRNYTHAQLEISSDINVIHGRNGHGKTSLLEAIYYTTLTQSFKTTQDRDCIQFASDPSFFDIRASYENRRGEADNIRVFYDRKNGKVISVNGDRLGTFKSHIGHIPTVLLKPDDLRLTYGSPSDRRTFLDVLLSQLSPVYLDSLMRYKKLVKQKNALLSGKAPVERAQLAAWNERLVEHGAVLLTKRRELLGELSVQVTEIYTDLAQTEQIASVAYATPLPSESEAAAALALRLEELATQEIAQQKCLVGPHRDDVACLLDDKPIGKFGSQGENKTFLIAMKLAEMSILGEKKSEKPLLLFDDIFSELDAFRIAQLMEKIKDFGQVFITTTDEKIIGEIPANKIKIEHGRLA